MLAYLGAILCALFMSAGQLLFKASAKRLAAASALDPTFLTLFGGALGLYGLMSIAWVTLLQHIELSRAYPFMALSFVLVPIGEMLVFRQPIPNHHFVGALLIMAGIVYIGLAGSSGGTSG